MTETVGGKAMPRLPHRVNYVGNGNDLDPVRGWEIFEGMERLTPGVARVGHDLRLETDRCGVYVVRLPVNAGMVETLERVSRLTCGCRVIVDVCVNLWSEDESENDSLIATDPRWWRTVARPRLERAMRCADLVTVPVPHLVAAVSRLNERVAVVPDCPDGEVVDEAVVGWIEAIALALGPRHRGEGS